MVKVTSREQYDTPVSPPDRAELLVASGDEVETGQVLARVAAGCGGRRDAPVNGFLARVDQGLDVRAEDIEQREYQVPHYAELLVDNGHDILAGDASPRIDQSAGAPPDPGHGHGAALPGH